jgi:glutathione S-transferase
VRCELSSAMKDVKLVYFDIRGRAELARLIMHAAGQPFDDIVTEDKAEYESSLMFGQLPLFLDRDVKLVQSGAIVRYLVKKLGMCGKSEQDQLMCDQLYEGTEDIFNALWNVCIIYRGGTREALDKAVAEDGIIYKYLVRLFSLSMTSMSFE